MNIRAALQREHSKENTEKIVEYFKSDDERLSELMDIFFNDSWELVQRAAWAVGKLGEKTNLLIPYIDQMAANIQKPGVHDAIIRNTVRTWQFMNIPDKHLGQVAQLCFDYLEKHETPIAVKVFSMVVLEKVVKREPELKNELKFLIEEQLPYGSAAFKSRGKKVLASLAKL